MNRGDTRPFEDQRLGVPGIGTESEADQHLKDMVKNQLDTNVSLQRLIIQSNVIVVGFVDSDNRAIDMGRNVMCLANNTS